MASALLKAPSASMLQARRPQTSRKALVVNARSAKSAAYVCTDCGYIYDGDIATAKGTYRCPVCDAPKKRFREFKGNVGSRSNDAKTMSSRRDKLIAQLEAAGESVEDGATELLVTYGTGAIVALGALYFFFVNRG